MQDKPKPAKRGRPFKAPDWKLVQRLAAERLKAEIAAARAEAATAPLYRGGW